MALPPDLRAILRKILFWGMILFLVINAFSWSPGYGGRRNQKGMEVERYFGWPACFRAELWRSDHRHEINILAYMPPVPLAGEMSLAVAYHSATALVLNLAFAGCLIGIVQLFAWIDHRRRADPWTIALIAALVAAALGLLHIADRCDAHL